MSRPSLDELYRRRRGKVLVHEDVLTLLRSGPLTIAELAEGLAVSHTCVREYIGDLLQAGYLDREYRRYPGPYEYRVVSGET